MWSVYRSGYSQILLPTLFRCCALRWFLSNIAMRREPLCPKPGITCFWHDVLHHIRWRYPSFFAHTGSCARPNSSRRLRFNYYNRSLQVVTPAPAGLEDGPSRHYLCNPCVGAWTPTSQCPSGALARFFPEGNGLTSNVTRSAHQKYTCNATSTGKVSRGCSHSLMFRLPRSLAPQVAPTAKELSL